MSPPPVVAVLLFLGLLVQTSSAGDGLVRTRRNARGGDAGTEASRDAFQLVLTRQRARQTGHAGWYTAETRAVYKPQRVAMVVLDLYQFPQCTGTRWRTESKAQAINDTIAAARALGVHIIHAPTGGIGRHYSNHKAHTRLLTQEHAKSRPPPPPPPSAEGERPPSPFRQHQPAASGANGTVTDCGCACDTYPLETDQVNTGSQHPDVYIDARRDSIVDIVHNATLAWERVIAAHEIELALIVGVLPVDPLPHLGLQTLLNWGVNVAIVRELVDMTVNPYAPPYLNYDASRDLALRYLEQFWAYTTSQYDILQPHATLATTTKRGTGDEDDDDDRNPMTSGADQFVLRNTKIHSDDECFIPPPISLASVPPQPVPPMERLSDTVILAAVLSAVLVGVLGVFAAYRARAALTPTHSSGGSASLASMRAASNTASTNFHANATMLSSPVDHHHIDLDTDHDDEILNSKDTTPLLDLS